MADKRKIEQLEDEHIRKTRQFNELEWDYLDMRADVQRHAEDMADWVSYFYREAPTISAGAALDQIFSFQEEFEMELRKYENRLEDAREEEMKAFHKELNRLYDEK